MKLLVGSVFKYSAVITKLRAMYSRLLTKEDYAALSMMTSVSEVVHYLKDSAGYSELLADINESTVHRGTLEHLFGGDIVRDAKKISSMLNNKENQVLHVFMSKYEIDIIKRAVRNIFTGGGSYAVAVYTDLPYKNFDPEKCFEASSLNELAKILGKTVYGEVIMRFTAFEPKSPWDIETALDEFYFERLNNVSGKCLSSSDARAVKELLSAEIGAGDILCIYRYKKYYDMPPDEIINHIIPVKRKISRGKLLELASCELGDFSDIVKTLRYSDIFSGAEEQEWDKRIKGYLYRLYHRQLRGSAYGFCTVLCYLYLKELEINNIITVVEGVRYGVAPESIRRYLCFDGHVVYGK